LIIA
jgi:hypothetical protein